MAALPLKEGAKLVALLAVYLLLLTNYFTTPAPRSLRGLVVPDFLAAWLRERPLCKDVAARCADGACGDGVPKRCADAARAGVGAASGRCYAALSAVEAAADAPRAVRDARACIRRRFRGAFARQGLPPPKLAIPADWTPA